MTYDHYIDGLMTYDHYINDRMIYDHYTSDLMTYDLKYLIELHDSTLFY
jgi:hypothetical protein